MKIPVLMIQLVFSGLSWACILQGQPAHAVPPPATTPAVAKSALFHGRRTQLTHSILIDAAPDRVFPLLCPVREGEWAEGWVGRPIYSTTGVSEENAVIETEDEGGAKTLWFVITYAPKARVNELVYWMPEGQLVRLHMKVSAQGPRQSRIDVKYIRTGLSDQGNQSLLESEAHFLAMMNEWQASLNHHLATGTILHTGH